MADKKITELTQLGETPSQTDALVIVDISTGETKQVDFQYIHSPSVFGSEYQCTESEGTSSTASNSYVEKLKLTTTSLPSGNYNLTWFYEIRNTTNDDMHESRVHEDDSLVISEESGAHKKPGGIDSWRPSSGFKNLTGISGIKTFDIDFRAPETTVEIRRARLCIWRVS